MKRRFHASITRDGGWLIAQCLDVDVARFSEVSRRGSHVKFAKDAAQGLRTVIVPAHR